MNIVFHASAGTGKTYQVTNLYVSLILGRPYETLDADGKVLRLWNPTDGPIDPRRILLMTFTDNAAAELRTRVTQLVLKARYEAEQAGDDAAIDAIIRVLRALPSSPISTIHSFCTSYLREHALDAGLSPGFSVLDQEQADELLAEIATDELLARLGGSGRDADFDAFCQSEQSILGGSEFSRGVTGAVIDLLRQAASKGLSLKDAEAMLPAPAQTVTRDDFAAVLDQLKKIRAARSGKLPDKAAAVFQCLENSLKKFPTLGKTATVEQFVTDLAQAESLSFSGKELTEVSGRLKRLVTQVQDAARYEAHYPAIRAFARYAAVVAAKYDERKNQIGVLDFDDLLIRTRDLLKPRDSASGAFDFLIVDEVQDTSRVQCDIIERLWEPGANHLAICGDTKQAIYAWRNADPRVMPDLESEIAKAKTPRTVALQASYRSKDAIVELVNRLFERVYGESYTKDERLIATKEKNAFVLKKGEGPCVELMKAPWEVQGPESKVQSEEAQEEELPDGDERVKMEMEAVARRIKLLVDGPAEWQPKFRYADGSETFEPVADGNRFRYADVLVLLRRTTKQQVLEHFLREHGIPYRVGGRGKGLFARQEVKDALLFLRAVTRPFDAIALIGFLRSPWIGLSDEDILQLGWADTSFNEERFGRAVVSDEGSSILPGSEPLARARELLRLFRSQADYRLASELLRELLQRTAYDAVITGTFRGAQNLANLRKLIDWLRGAERGGQVLLSDVVASLEEHCDEPPEIPEAAMLDPEQNAVTLMTVHGAKGLTSRVVFVPEMSSRPPNRTPWAMLAENGDGSHVLHVKTEDLERQDTFTTGFEEAKAATREVRDAESNNIFYVAMTRARDLVVLSGARTEKNSSTWRADFDALLAESDDARNLVKAFSYGDVEAAFAKHITADAGQGVDERAKAVPPAALFRAATDTYPRPLPAPRVLRFPATVLSAFCRDPDEFVRTRLSGAEAPWLRHRQAPGEADAGGSNIPPIRDDEPGASYAAFGTAGHEALEILAQSGWAGDLGALARSAAKANGLGENEGVEIERRLGDVVRIMRDLAPASAAIFAEWPFAMSLGGTTTTLIVDGTMDVLVRHGDGSWHILDYKFTDEEPAELVRHYSLQLNLYREALRRRGGKDAGAVTMTLIAVGRSGTKAVDVPEDPGTEAVALAAAKDLDSRMRGAEAERRSGEPLSRQSTRGTRNGHGG